LNCMVSPPNKATYKLASRPGTPDLNQPLNRVYAALNKLNAPNVHGPIQFQIIYTINP
jgi:hypothetical protein